MNRQAKAYAFISCMSLLGVVATIAIVFVDLDWNRETGRPQNHIAPVDGMAFYLICAAERLSRWEDWERNRHVFNFMTRVDLGDLYADAIAYLNEHDFYFKE